MLADGSFADVKCSEPFPYLCYKKATPGMAMTACGTTDTCKSIFSIVLEKLLLFECIQVFSERINCIFKLIYY